ncbi:MAG TPA: lipoyl(octanoyl) transferase LipB [Vicinamibacterales bacterium]|nr:lipoyl(octanoyl) transferase LipB [Vicinamibacterales bacterium]
MRSLDVRRLGVVPYAEGLELQKRLVDERRAGRIADTLLLLEHPHVLTVGVKKDGRAHILAPTDRLEALAVEVFDTGRGGDVTYHGPGQVVGYPIIDLNPDRRDVHRYVRDIEEVMIGVCAEFGVGAGRIAGLSGTWVRLPDRGAEKVGAIGVRISRWITSHGFALNVATDLAFFDLIVPCGIADHGVTSLERASGRTLAVAEVESSCARHFAAVFDREVTHSLSSA